MNRKWDVTRSDPEGVIKLLIIDDDPVITAIYKKYFEQAKFRVEVANDSIAGLVLLQTFNPSVVLLDLNMPYRDGIEWLRSVRSNERFKRLPVLILTGQAPESPQAMAALDSDVTGVLFKPLWAPEAVVAAVKWAAVNRPPPAMAAR